MVRELSKHQSAFLFDCCIVIARFASLSCYSSAKTRIQPVKSYQNLSRRGSELDNDKPIEEESCRAFTVTVRFSNESISVFFKNRSVLFHQHDLSSCSGTCFQHLLQLYLDAVPFQQKLSSPLLIQ